MPIDPAQTPKQESTGRNSASDQPNGDWHSSTQNRAPLDVGIRQRIFLREFASLDQVFGHLLCLNPFKLELK